MKSLTSALTKLVAILNDGQYHNNLALCNTLGLVPDKVDQLIATLKSYGVKIDSINEKGYALLEPLILLNQKTIKQNISQSAIDLEIFETISSTNEYLKSFVGAAHSIKICLAEQQTAGKGRFDRSWHSPFGQNIYFSCLYPLQKNLSELAGISLIISLAIVKTLEAYALPQAIQVKWPNDIIYNQQKISGNLLEIQPESNSVIIGIGINVNMLPDNHIPFSQPWTSLRNIMGHYFDRNQLCITLIDNLLDYLHQFQQIGLSSFIEEWNRVDYLYNKEISLQCGTQEIHGKSQGINEQGHLAIQLNDGVIKSFSSGDTTILK